MACRENLPASSQLMHRMMGHPAVSRVAPSRLPPLLVLLSSCCRVLTEAGRRSLLFTFAALRRALTSSAESVCKCAQQTCTSLSLPWEAGDGSSFQATRAALVVTVQPRPVISMNIACNAAAGARRRGRPARGSGSRGTRSLVPI